MRRLIKQYPARHDFDKVLPAFGPASGAVDSIVVAIAEAAELNGAAGIKFYGTGAAAEIPLEMLQAESFTFRFAAGQK